MSRCTATAQHVAVGWAGLRYDKANGIEKYQIALDEI